MNDKKNFNMATQSYMNTCQGVPKVKGHLWSVLICFFSMVTCTLLNHQLIIYISGDSQDQPPVRALCLSQLLHLKGRRPNSISIRHIISSYQPSPHDFFYSVLCWLIKGKVQRLSWTLLVFNDSKLAALAKTKANSWSPTNIWQGVLINNGMCPKCL